MTSTAASTGIAKDTPSAQREHSAHSMHVSGVTCSPARQGRPWRAPTAASTESGRRRRTAAGRRHGAGARATAGNPPAATAFMALMPTTSPKRFTKGPPELPCSSSHPAAGGGGRGGRKWQAWAARLLGGGPGAGRAAGRAGGGPRGSVNRYHACLHVSLYTHLVDRGVGLDVVRAGARQPQLHRLAVHTAAQARRGMGGM